MPKKQMTKEPRIARQQFPVEELLTKATNALEEGQYDVGFCEACGEEASQVEPDAEEYQCESCGESRVTGAEEIVLKYAW